MLPTAHQPQETVPPVPASDASPSSPSPEPFLQGDAVSQSVPPVPASNASSAPLSSLSSPSPEPFLQGDSVSQSAPLVNSTEADKRSLRVRPNDDSDGPVVLTAHVLLPNTEEESGALLTDWLFRRTLVVREKSLPFVIQYGVAPVAWLFWMCSCITSTRRGVFLVKKDETNQTLAPFDTDFPDLVEFDWTNDPLPVDVVDGVAQPLEYSGALDFYFWIPPEVRKDGVKAVEPDFQTNHISSADPNKLGHRGRFRTRVQNRDVTNVVDQETENDDCEACHMSGRGKGSPVSLCLVNPTPH